MALINKDLKQCSLTIRKDDTVPILAQKKQANKVQNLKVPCREPT